MALNDSFTILLRNHRSTAKNSNFTFCVRPRAERPLPPESVFDLSTANSFFSKKTTIFTGFSLFRQKRQKKKSHFSVSWREKKGKIRIKFRVGEGRDWWEANGQGAENKQCTARPHVALYCVDRTIHEKFFSERLIFRNFWFWRKN